MTSPLVERREGAVTFRGPIVATGRGPRARAPVFYNPAMAGDRDLAVAFVRAWAPGAPADRSGWEPTAATGVRGLRLVAETGAFRAFLLTEANVAAYEVLRENARAWAAATADRADGRNLPRSAPFDYVDLDPYGSPAPFVPTGLAAVRLGGVLAVTATDMIVLAGAQPSATLRRYGARPVRGRLGPEGGLRILLAHLASRARDAGRGIRPLLAYGRDHGIRAYVEVTAAPVEPPPVATIDPATWTGPPLGAPGPFGPMWLGPLVDPGIAARLAVPPTAEAPGPLARTLAFLRGDAEVPAPFYYEPNTLAARLGLPQPPSIADLLRAIEGAGYRAARSQFRPEAIRTDAPRATVDAAARDAAPAQSQNARVRA